MTDRANEAATFGEKLEDATKAASQLYIQFGQFTKEGRKSALTVTDMQASMETASRTMAGWSSDFRSMSEFQKAFIAGSEQAGMSSKGAAESFGSFVGEIGNMDMQTLLMLRDTFKSIASPGLVKSIEELGAQWGGGALGEAFAMKRFMKQSVTEGKQGDLSEFIFAMTKSSVEYSKRVGGGDYAGVMALQQAGFSEDSAVKMIEGFDKMEEAYREGKGVDKALLAAAEQDVRNAEKRAREASMTLTQKIQAGISLWWREVAPALFSTIVNGFGMVADGLILVASYLPGGPDEKRAIAKERMAIRSEQLSENAKIIQEATAKMLKQVGQDIGGSFVRALGGEPLPEYPTEKLAETPQFAKNLATTAASQGAALGMGFGMLTKGGREALGIPTSGGGGGESSGIAKVEQMADNSIRISFSYAPEIILPGGMLGKSVEGERIASGPLRTQPQA